MKIIIFNILLLISTFSQATLISSTDEWRGKWGEQTVGVGATITYSLMATGTSCERLGAGCTFINFDDFLPSAWESILTDAFGAWSSVADLTFIEVGDEGEEFNDGSNSGMIRLGGRIMDGTNGRLATGYYPGEGGAAMGGDLHLDVDEIWDIDIFGAGFDLLSILTHEIGHTIGLKHSDDRDSLMFGLYQTRTNGIQEHDAEIAAALYGNPEGFQDSNQSVQVSAPPMFYLFIVALAMLIYVPRKPKGILIR